LTNDKNQTLKHILFNNIPGREHLLLTVKLTGVEQKRKYTSWWFAVYKVI